MYVYTYTVDSIYSPWYVASPFVIRRLAKQSKQNSKIRKHSFSRKTQKCRNIKWHVEWWNRSATQDLFSICIDGLFEFVLRRMGITCSVVNISKLIGSARKSRAKPARDSTMVTQTGLRDNGHMTRHLIRTIPLAKAGWVGRELLLQPFYNPSPTAWEV